MAGIRFWLCLFPSLFCSAAFTPVSVYGYGPENCFINFFSVLARADGLELLVLGLLDHRLDQQLGHSLDRDQNQQSLILLQRRRHYVTQNV